jgi:hypothetical protein
MDIDFIRSMVSKKLTVTAAAIGLIQTLPMNADWKGICTASVAFAYVIAQAWVDSKSPTQTTEPAMKESPMETATTQPSPPPAPTAVPIVLPVYNFQEEKK